MLITVGTELRETTRDSEASGADKSWERLPVLSLKGQGEGRTYWTHRERQPREVSYAGREVCREKRASDCSQGESDSQGDK